MTLTVNEVIERMRRWDEVYLLERLEISSEDLIERFSDKIEDRYFELMEEVSE